MKSVITFGLASLLGLPAMSCAQDRRSTTGHPTEHQFQNGPAAEDRTSSKAEKSSRRLESVTWNSVKHELTWVISTGDKKSGASFKQTGAENYLINMDDATMTFSGETRRFSKEEATNVHVLMDIIAKYAVDSTIWWDEGQGEPLNGDGKGTKKPEKPQTPNTEDLPVLHIADRSPTTRPGLSSSSIEQEVRRLERKLAELKRLQMILDGRFELTSYASGR
jgi:hypothetical protein